MNNFIKKIKTAVSNFFGYLLGFLMRNGDVAIKVTNIVKEIVENPSVEWIVVMTPTSADDVILSRAKIIAPKIAAEVALAMGVIKEFHLDGTPEQITGNVFELIRNMIPEKGRAIFYREFSGAVADALSDGEITRAEQIALVQLLFKKIL